jgi:hypothetical protein
MEDFPAPAEVAFGEAHMNDRAPAPALAQTESQMIDAIQRGAFGYFLHEANDANGLVRDKTQLDWPASIAAVGLGLTAYPVGVERGFVTRT